MPSALSYESLRAHLDRNTDTDRPGDRVYFYDAHTYYSLSKPDEIDRARNFREQLQERFPGGSDQFYYGPFHLKLVGPHYEGQFKIVFTRHDYVELINWLVLHRPEDLSILVHPHTLDAAADHTHRALWLGPPFKVKTDRLEESTLKWKQKLAEGEDEGELLWQTYV